jgi:hypothetical protein
MQINSVHGSQILRTPDEIRRAHDLLVGSLAVLLKAMEDSGTCATTPSEFYDNPVTCQMEASADVLCWILGCDEDHEFVRRLEHLEHTMQDYGYQLVEKEV